MLLGEIIANYRKEHDLSQRQFSALCKGVSNGYISMIENNCNPSTGKPIVPSLDKLRIIANAMNMTLQDLLTLADDMPVDISKPPASLTDRTILNQHEKLTGIKQPDLDLLSMFDVITDPIMTFVPVIGVVRAGPNGLAFEEPLGREPAHISGRAEDHFYLKVVGDSMTPEISEGDLALVRIQPDAESGELVVAIIDEEEGTIKKLIKKPGTLVLQAFNPAYPPRIFTGEEMNSVRIVGKVIRTVRIW